MVNTGKLKGTIYSAGYTIKQLAEAMGIEYNLFSKKVCGRVGFTAQQAFMLCKLLDLSEEDARNIFMLEKVTEGEQCIAKK